MEAFAKDSKNNVLGGSGPLNKDIDFAQFHGRGAEGFTDFSTSGTGGANPTVEPYNYEPYAGASAPIRTGPGVRPGVDRTSSFNPRSRVDHVHGEETLGLGTSTFLEGAPAARAAIQRRESDTDGVNGAGMENGGGLGRKRSLAQKIRGISNANRDRGFRPAGSNAQKVTSPGEDTKERTTSPTEERVQSAGGMPRIQEGGNPFFHDHNGGTAGGAGDAGADDVYERKGQKIQIAEEQRKGLLTRKGSIGGGEEAFNANASAAKERNRGRAVSSPKKVGVGMLERRVTNDGTPAPVAAQAPTESNAVGGSGGGGFLSRVKSLKGGKRGRAL